MSTPARDRLLDAAIEAFAERGYGSTTTRDIAARARMSPAAVYVHHATKEDLLFAVSLRGHQRALDVLSSAARSEGSPVERIAAMVRAFSQWHARNSRVGRVVQYEFGALTPEHRAVIADLRRRMEHLMQDALAAGVGEGVCEVTDLRGTARAVLSLSVDLVRWFEPGRAHTPDELGQLHADLAVRMLRPSA
ncbi:MAG: TetR/AcrR family transcriptional regulator [Aeromicrobium sp.]|uniref:TetR/AcrR family transcriptional regulator n=1 Tax=Aeromicrobium sp. TaxID=1871063 RepID=UPI0039E2DB92